MNRAGEQPVYEGVLALLTYEDQSILQGVCLTPLMCLGKLAAWRRSSCPLNVPAAPMPSDPYQSFADFYPYYLSQHRTAACRRMHVIGTVLVLVLLAAAVLSATWWLLALVPLAGYGFAWIGHFAFERNKPATFTHPWYSLAADFVMLRDVLAGRIKF